MRQNLSVFIAFTAAACAAAPGRAQVVDLSCIGVQAMAAHMRVDTLPNPGAYAPVLARIDNYQKSALGAVEPAEKRWATARKDAEDRIRAANPDASDSAVQAKLAQKIRQDAELDNRLAGILVAQATAHEAEMKIILESHLIPAKDNSEQVTAISVAHAQASGVRPELVEAIENSTALQQLVGTLATSTAAMKSSENIPAAPLAGINFDRGGPRGRVEVVAEAVAQVVAEADASRQHAKLIGDHIERLLGNAETRRALTTDPDKETARTANLQIGQALTDYQKSNAVLGRLNNIKLDQIKVPAPDLAKPGPAATKAWVDKVVDQVEEEVTIIKTIYGLPPGVRGQVDHAVGKHDRK